MLADMTLAEVTVPKDIYIPGYVLTENILRQVDTKAKRIMASIQKNQTSNLQFHCWASGEAGNAMSFDSIDALINHLNVEANDFHTIFIKYIIPANTSISVTFLPNGVIKISAIGNGTVFLSEVDMLIKELQKCDSKHGWFINKQIFPEQKFPWLLVAFLVFILATSIAYYSYNSNLISNLDPNLINRGSTHVQEIQNALNSSSTNEKLDVLLISQLGNLSYLLPIISVLTWTIKLTFVALISLFLLLIFRRGIRKLYPLSFFAFGDNKDALTEIKRRRDIWWIAGLLAIAINIVTGIFLKIWGI